MAHKQGGGSTKNNRDSLPKNLGFKKLNNELINMGEIILRQHGAKFISNKNVGMTKDYTLFALKRGFIIINNNKISIMEYI